MAQAKVQGKGFGILYPDGVTGIKVVHTFTEAPKKIINPDGSYTHTTPPPTIHELYAGMGFVYASGERVSDRKHLENIADPDMKARALDWYDKHGKVIIDEVIERPESIERPEPAFIASDQVPPEVLETGQMPHGQMAQQPTYKRRSEEAIEQPNEVADLLRSISTNLTGLVNTVGEHGKQMSELTKTVKHQQEDIKELKKYPMTKERIAGIAHKKQGEVMKKKWQDPEFKAKMRERMVRGKREAEMEETNERLPDNQSDEERDTG